MLGIDYENNDVNVKELDLFRERNSKVSLMQGWQLKKGVDGFEKCTLLVFVFLGIDYENNDVNIK